MTTTEMISNDVKRIIKQYGTNDPAELCRMLNYNIEFSDLMPTNLKAVFTIILDRKIIMINDRINRFFIPVLLAHELGHGILKHELACYHDITVAYSPRIDKKEYEANLFAAELLLDDIYVWSELHQGRTYMSLARELNVPIALMEFKLKLLSDKGYIMNDIPTPQSCFLKDNNEAYTNEWFV